MIRVALDTNVILDCLLDRFDARSYDSLLAAIHAGTVDPVIPIAVFLEIEWVLKTSYRQPPQQRVMLLRIARDLLGDRDEQVATIDAALQLFEREPTIGFEDCVIAIAALQDGVDDLITGDKKLARLYHRLKKGHR